MKLVIPCAGKGTRMAPITSYLCKEMIPILDKPMIEYAVQEALNTQLINEIILVITPEKEIIYDYLTARYGYKCKFTKVYQDEQLGFGHAILCAKEAVGPSDFAMMLPDELILDCGGNFYDLINSGKYGILFEQKLGQHAEIYDVVLEWSDRTGESTIGIHKYVCKPERLITDMRYPTTVGRYLLPNEIFESLEKIPFGRNGELQLADAMEHCRETGISFSGIPFNGSKFDCGNRTDYFKTLKALLPVGL